LLSASAKDEIINVLGVEVANAKMGKLHFKINGVDLMEHYVVDDVEISVDVEQPTETKPEKIA
jgi:hypothetical protein